MPIVVKCSCGRKLGVDESRAGQKGQCPVCKAIFTVPVPTPPNATPHVATVVTKPISYSCPHCDIALEVEASAAGKTVQCGACHKMTVVPDRSNPSPSRPTSPSRESPFSIDLRGDFDYGRLVTKVDTSSVWVPILISAIGNVAVGLLWVSTVVCLPVGIGMIALCVFEFLFYSKVDTLHPREVLSKANSLAILEIVAGLFNLISLVCGIIVLINIGK